MRYLLDTNLCIQHLNRRSQTIIDRLASLPPDEIAVCSVVKAELFYGAQKSRQPVVTLQRQRQFLDQFVSLPFDDRAAEAYAQIRATLEAAGTPIGPYDLQIAAIALAHGLIVVTHNTREFGRVAGLLFEDWNE
ncbi:MAG: type II toxin-antitoxin system VapC family toxin [Anaerolineae bacterium]